MFFSPDLQTLHENSRKPFFAILFIPIMVSFFYSVAEQLRLSVSQGHPGLLILTAIHYERKVFLC